MIAAFTYLSTMEPTASFWDCPEFISTAFKFDVGHPPGAPFFMLLGHFFTLFASDVAHVAVMVNSMSALASAGTILFLFWTITLLAAKVVKKENGEYTLVQGISILCAGMVGALAYTWSDTFWFSAVEGEVYALSSLFTAAVFWAILKWDEHYGEEGASRWLLLIAYLMGLSIGVHLLNLLAIPAIVLVYYFRNHQTENGTTATWKGTIFALLISFALLVFMMYGIIPGVVMVGTWFELAAVNGLGFGFNSGFTFFLVLLFCVLIMGVLTTYKASKQNDNDNTVARIFTIAGITLMGIPFVAGKIWLGIILIVVMVFALLVKKMVRISVLNTVITAVALIAVGYMSFAVIVIRSAANPTMDQNSPDNVFNLKSYLNREQYGDRPLFYGPYYNAEIEWKVEGDNYVPVIKEGDDIWSQKEKDSADEPDKYIVTDKQKEYGYVGEMCTVLPRMYSQQASHISAYKEWGGNTGKQITYENAGRQMEGTVPTMGENLRFFFNYQVAYMYLRYFMWNFSGRQNDIQGYGENNHGMILTGIPFVDSMWEGDYKYLPTVMKENKGRNVYYMLPLLLGLLGMAWQWRRGKSGKQSFWVTMTFFFMTGLAIVLYLNQTPYQPRERDYAYAGSFYAFSIWIGLGLMGLIGLVNKITKGKGEKAVLAVATVAGLLVPVQMASQNWDDHDRSNRFTCRDFGYNYLISCADNAIIFTNGDNDTFPLWYLQEVEGVRRDVRVCNLSYLQTDWYIDQMRRQAYESKPLPISWKRKQYVQGTRDVMYAQNLITDTMELKELIDTYVLNDDLSSDGYAHVPTRHAYVNGVSGSVLKGDSLHGYELSKVYVPLKERTFKHEEMILEMLARNNWERPMYFAVTVGDSYYMGLKKNFQLEGMAYRIVPRERKDGDVMVDTDKMYDNMMNKFRWGGVENGDVYIDENNMRMCLTFRLMWIRLTDALIAEGKIDKAKKALDKCLEVIPGKSVPHDAYSMYIAQNYIKVGEKEKGMRLLAEITKGADEYLVWYSHLPNKRIKRLLEDEAGRNEYIIRFCQSLTN